MDLLRKIKKSMDIPSTPTAPKIGKIPLPEIDSPVLARSPLVLPDEDVVVAVRYSSPASPLSPTTRRRAGSVVSRAATPQCIPRATTPAYPTPSPELYAPTPKWRTQRTLLDQDWSSCSPTPDPQVLKERSRTLSSVRSPPPRASSSRHYERSSESPEDLKKHKKHQSMTPQPELRASSSCAHKVIETPRPESAKRPIKGILKSAPPKSARSDATELHWQLLPYDPSRCKKKLYFDIAMPPDYIRDHTRLPPVALHPSETDKWAAQQRDGLTRMMIKCEYLPHWPIIVENDQGIKCHDIFAAIHRYLTLRLTKYEEDSYIEPSRKSQVEAAYKRRCRDDPRMDHIVRREGRLRVDLLEGKRIFMGLTRPQDGGEYWWLNVGLPLVDDSQ